MSLSALSLSLLSLAVNPLDSERHMPQSQVQATGFQGSVPRHEVMMPKVPPLSRFDARPRPVATVQVW
jgi:hypothetical protein